MSRRNALALDLMTEQGLWSRLSTNLWKLENHWTQNLNEREIRMMATECRDIVVELRRRQAQLALFP